MSGLRIEHKTELHIVRWTSLLIVISMTVAALYIAFKWYETGMLPSFMPIVSANPGADESPVNTGSSRQIPSSQPASLSISKIGIDNAAIRKVGLSDRKLIDPPRNIHEAGWYEQSALPGSKAGATILVGVSRGMTKQGLFGSVTDLETGDTITVTTGDSKKHVYYVSSVEMIDAIQLTQPDISRQIASPISNDRKGLNIVVSIGNWVPKTGTYDKRVIIRSQT